MIQYKRRYDASKQYDENDIFIFFDPTWRHPDYPDGLAFFDTKHNCAAILGMSYFGGNQERNVNISMGQLPLVTITFLATVV